MLSNRALGMLLQAVLVTIETIEESAENERLHLATELAGELATGMPHAHAHAKHRLIELLLKGEGRLEGLSTLFPCITDATGIAMIEAAVARRTEEFYTLLKAVT